MQLINNQKDEKISQLESHVKQLENRVTELENQVDEVNQYERRDTVIISGPDLPKEQQNENCVDNSPNSPLFSTYTEKFSASSFRRHFNKKKEKRQKSDSD